MVEIFHEGEPVAWARARVAGRKFSTAEKQRDAKEELEHAFLNSGHRKFDKSQSLEVTLTFSYQRPGSARHKLSMAGSVSHKPTRPDIDNLVKLVLDAGNGTLWEDDNQVVRLSAEKVFGDRAFTYIRVKGI